MLTSQTYVKYTQYDRSLLSYIGVLMNNESMTIIWVLIYGVVYYVLSIGNQFSYGCCHSILAISLDMYTWNIIQNFFFCCNFRFQLYCGW